MLAPSLKEVLDRTLKSKEVSINGWVTNVRKMKNVTFLDVNDGTCLNHLQVVVDKKFDKLPFMVGAAILAHGKVSEARGGQLELQAAKIEVTNTCLHPQYPFAATAKQQYTPQYVRQFLHLRSRNKLFAATMRVRHTAQKAFHDYFDAQGYINIHTPILTANDCEGSGEVFVSRPENDELLKEMKRADVQVDDAYFDRKAYLTVSGQLHLEAMALGIQKVYNFNPAFRAENCKSPCHLAEFYMIEAEEAFVTEVQTVTEQVAELMKNVTRQVLDKRAEDISFILKSNNENFEAVEKEFAWLDLDYPVISYVEAINILRNHRNELKVPPKEEEGLCKDHEQFLTKYFNGPIFVAYWPKEIKPFYMRRTIEHPIFVDCFDFLVPDVGELVGGSIREANFDALKARLPDPKALDWYLDLRQYGAATTGGFGLGFERYLQYILHVKNIRDVVPFPRWPHHCET